MQSIRRKEPEMEVLEVTHAVVITYAAWLYYLQNEATGFVMQICSTAVVVSGEQ